MSENSKREFVKYIDDIEGLLNIALNGGQISDVLLEDIDVTKYHTLKVEEEFYGYSIYGYRDLTEKEKQYREKRREQSRKRAEAKKQTAKEKRLQQYEKLKEEFDNA